MTVVEALLLAVSCTVCGWVGRGMWTRTVRALPAHLGSVTYECARCRRRIPGGPQHFTTGTDLTVLFSPDLALLCDCWASSRLEAHP